MDTSMNLVRQYIELLLVYMTLFGTIYYSRCKFILFAYIYFRLCIVYKLCAPLEGRLLRIPRAGMIFLVDPLGLSVVAVVYLIIGYADYAVVYNVIKYGRQDER